MLRRLYHQHKEVFFLPLAGDKSGVNLFPCQFIIQNKITVAGIIRRILQTHIRHGISLFLNDNIMGTACQLRYGYTRRNGYMDIVRIRRCRSIGKIWDARPLLSGSGIVQRRTYIARPHNRGIDKLVYAFRGHNQFRIMQFNPHFVTRHDVCYIHGKHIGSLFRQHGSTFSLTFGCFKFLLCFLFFFNHCRHCLIPDLHLHTVYRNFGRCRKNITGIDRFVSLIGICLHHIGICNNPLD